MNRKTAFILLLLCLPSAAPAAEPWKTYSDAMAAGRRSQGARKFDEAAAAYAAAAALAAGADAQAAALTARAGILTFQDRDAEAAAIHAAVAALPNLDVNLKAGAMMDRAEALAKLGQYDDACRILDAMADLSGVAAEQKVAAHLRRPRLKSPYGRWIDHETAIAQFEAALKMPGITPEQQAKAQWGIADRYEQLRYNDRAVAAFEKLAANEAAPAATRADALTRIAQCRRFWRQARRPSRPMDGS